MFCGECSRDVLIRSRRARSNSLIIIKQISPLPQISLLFAFPVWSTFRSRFDEHLMTPARYPTRGLGDLGTFPLFWPSYIKAPAHTSTSRHQETFLDPSTLPRLFSACCERYLGSVFVIPCGRHWSHLAFRHRSVSAIGSRIPWCPPRGISRVLDVLS